MVVTLGVMLSLFMGSMEATVVSTAMPTIVSQMGGLEIYSWVFTAYMLASTTSVPIFGKLSDLYGRRPVYGAAMAFFLVGSVLCGLARTMPQLIAFRALQGLGSGGLMPLAFIMIGDMYTFEQRARIQGLFSGVWGVSSIVGPLLGGFLVDAVSWPWVFYVNIIPGILATIIVWRAWVDPIRDPRAPKPSVDYAGAVLLSGSVVALLMGLFQLGTSAGWALLALAILLLAALGWVDRSARDPILPLQLFRNRLFAVACIHGVLAGAAMFGSSSFIPLFVQVVLGTSATVAGSALTPMMLGWVSSSIIGGRLLLHMGYRTLALAGMLALTLGAFMMSRIGIGTSRAEIMVYVALMGVGMGLSIPAFLIAVQNAVRKRELGVATSTIQFTRSIGGALGVSVMGLILSLQLAAGLRAQGLDPAAVSLDRLLDPLAQSAATDAPVEALRTALAGAVAGVFLLSFVASALGLLVTAMAPGGRIADLGPGRSESAAAGRAAETRPGGAD